jgi:hypothetical protein
MTQHLDVTGLSCDEVRMVQSLVDLLRDRQSETATAPASIFDLIGKVDSLRTGEDIVRQVREEHDAWVCRPAGAPTVL